jgi:hypothetical protein
MEEKEFLIDSQFEEVVKNKVKELLAANQNVKKIYPIVVEGIVDEGEKPYYVAYMRTPDMKTFSKFMMSNTANAVIAQQQLARDCFLDGDKELLTDDDLFLRGLMPKLNVLVESRNAKVVNFSKA